MNKCGVNCMDSKYKSVHSELKCLQKEIDEAKEAIKNIEQNYLGREFTEEASYMYSGYSRDVDNNQQRIKEIIESL